MVLPSACMMTLVSQTFNLPLNQLSASLFPRFWDGWVVWHIIISFWRALWSFWSCFWKHSQYMAKLLVFSILQGQHIQSCGKTFFVCAQTWWEQSARPHFHVCPLQHVFWSQRRHTSRWAHIGRVRTYSPCLFFRLSGYPGARAL